MLNLLVGATGNRRAMVVEFAVAPAPPKGTPAMSEFDYIFGTRLIEATELIGKFRIDLCARFVAEAAQRDVTLVTLRWVEGNKLVAGPGSAMRHPDDAPNAEIGLIVAVEDALKNALNVKALTAFEAVQFRQAFYSHLYKMRAVRPNTADTVIKATVTEFI